MTNSVVSVADSCSMLVTIRRNLMSSGSRDLMAALLCSVAACASTQAGARQPSAKDADAVEINRFQRVDERLYRGAQPDADGFRQLRDLGVKTIINLRLAKDALETDEQRIVESLGMRYVNLPVKDGNFFTWFRRIPEETIQSFLDVLAVETGPFFIHCRRGTDRTGAMVAFYRITHNAWEPDRAVKEAEQRGMRFWYRGLRRQIKAFDPAPFVDPARVKK